MRHESHRFEVGDFKCDAVGDGTFTYTAPMFPPLATFLFANASRERLEQALRRHDIQPSKWMEWISPYICLVINTGVNRVLVDTGAGALGPNTGKLLANLADIGIADADIDTVVLTHGHPDHIGGNAVEGNAAFPNARYVMCRDEWDFWTSKQVASKDDEHLELLMKMAQNNLAPISDRIDLIVAGTEIVEGVYSIPATGHTPGHMALSVSSNGDHLLCIADAVLHPIHVENPSWHATVDYSPEEVEKTRRKLFKQAAEWNALVLAFHFSFPGLGHIVREEDQWQWQPIYREH